MSSDMDVLELISSLVSSLAWPLLALTVVLILRKPLGELLGRLVRAKGYGIEAEFERAETSVALARAEAAASAPTAVVVEAGVATGTGQAHDATVKVRESLASTMSAAARAHPASAILAAYAEVENALRDRMEQAKVAGVDRLVGTELVDVALRKGVVSQQTADAFRGVLVLRNLAAHGEDTDAAKALEYLALADSVIYAIERWRPKG
jgi:hypothetical protein